MRSDHITQFGRNGGGKVNISYDDTEGKFGIIDHGDLPGVYTNSGSTSRRREGPESASSLASPNVSRTTFHDSNKDKPLKENSDKCFSDEISIANVKDGDEEGEGRQQWSNPIEFLLSCIALSVGLGNVWRFPITAYKNGGGAFLIPYLVVLLFIGRPLYFLELSLGQFSSYGCIKLWKCVPAIKGVGYSQVVATAAILTYYVSLMALTVFYFCVSFQSELPWSVCDPAWAAMDSCVAVSSNSSLGFSSNSSKQSSSEQFFRRYVVHEAATWTSGIGKPDWKLALCLAGSWLVLFFTLVKGVQSAGKTAYFTALFPYLVLFTLLGRGVTLPGAYDGIMYFLTPQWERLLDGN
ncbi:hypothetical protein HAZT_HAZT005658, partial [Hyalella azteca]